MENDKSENKSGKKIKEIIIVRDLGYLKVPQAVKQEYGTPTRYPNPDWHIIEDEENLLLVFKFAKKEIAELQLKDGD